MFSFFFFFGRCFTQDGSSAETPRSKSQMPLVSLQDRLLAALDSAELSNPPQRRVASKKPHTSAFARARANTLQWGPGGTPTGCFPSIKCFGGSSNFGLDRGTRSESCDAEAGTDDETVGDAATRPKLTIDVPGDNSDDDLDGGKQVAGGDYLLSNDAKRNGVRWAMLADMKVRTDVRKALLGRDGDSHSAAGEEGGIEGAKESTAMAQSQSARSARRDSSQPPIIDQLVFRGAMSS